MFVCDGTFVSRDVCSRCVFIGLKIYMLVYEFVEERILSDV